MTEAPRVATTSWGRVARSASHVAEPAYLDDLGPAVRAGATYFPRLVITVTRSPSFARCSASEAESCAVGLMSGR